MSSFLCAHGCRDPRTPDFTAIAATVAGARWWTVADTSMAQADAVHGLRCAGFCHRHAALLAELVVARIERERSLQSVPPARVTVREVEIWEHAADVGNAELRRLVGRLSKFVRSQPLAAIVEHDSKARRMRIILQLVTDGGAPGLEIDASLIERVTPEAMVMRMREAEHRRLDRSA